MTDQVGVVHEAEEDHKGGGGNTYQRKDLHSQRYGVGVDNTVPPTDHSPPSWEEGEEVHREGRGNNHIRLDIDFDLVSSFFYAVSPPPDIADYGTERDHYGGEEVGHCHGDYHADDARRRRMLHDEKTWSAADPRGQSVHSAGDGDVGKRHYHLKIERFDDLVRWVEAFSHVLWSYGEHAHHLIWYQKRELKHQDITPLYLPCSSL